MTQPDYNQAFQDGVGVEYTLQNDGSAVVERYTLRLHRVGELVLTSGHILACDPMLMFETPPFADPVPPGRYPVILSVAELPSGDKRVACALLRLREDAAVRWEIATPQGQTLSALTPARAFGYSVDFATGCFIDAEVPSMLVAQEAARTDGADEGEQFYERLDAMQSKTYVPTWSWADLLVDEATGANIIAFSSGWGDGCYPSYWGDGCYPSYWGDGCYPSYWGDDAADQRVALVTDFGVLNASWLAH